MLRSSPEFPLFSVIDLDILGIPQERLEWFAAVLEEFSEKLYVLQPAGMDERAEHVDRHTEHVADQADDDQCNCALESGSDHGAQQVDDARDNAGRQTECEQSRVG